jgi:hypothetical protein
MTQQLAIVAMIDVVAALQSGTLEGNIHLIDNNKWLGSSGVGSGNLTTVIDVARVNGLAQAQVLNWLVYGLERPPPSLPQSFFSKNNGGQHGELMDISGKILEGNELSQACPRSPDLTKISGEALDKGVIYPARYASPNLVNEGIYWSAVVNPDKPGIYSYTLHFTLYYPDGDRGRADKITWKTVDMTHRARIKLVNSPYKNGFAMVGERWQVGQ